MQFLLLLLSTILTKIILLIKLITFRWCISLGMFNRISGEIVLKAQILFVWFAGSMKRFQNPKHSYAGRVHGLKDSIHAQYI